MLSTAIPKCSISNEYVTFIDQKHFKLLDGIRGLSIAAVIWHHSGGVYPISSQFFGRGYLGVDMFFVLSGFLITFLLLKEKRITSTISLKKFYIRRTLRIFPLYFAFLGFITIWESLSNPSDLPQILQAFPYYFFYISNWIPEAIEQYFKHAWSLAVEEQFYLIWPLLFAAIPMIRSVSLTIAFVIVVTIFEMGLFGQNLALISWNFIPFRTLFLGCLLAITLCNPFGYKIFFEIFKHGLFISLVFILLIFSVARVDGPLTGVDLLTTHKLMVLFLAGAVINEENILKSLLTFRPLKICGIVSYGVYILHGQFWGITQKIVGAIPFAGIAESRITFFMVFLIISSSIAMLSYHFFESWFLRLKSRYGKY